MNEREKILSATLRAPSFIRCENIRMRWDFIIEFIDWCTMYDFTLRRWHNLQCVTYTHYSCDRWDEERGGSLCICSSKLIGENCAKLETIDLLPTQTHHDKDSFWKLGVWLAHELPQIDFLRVGKTMPPFLESFIAKFRNFALVRNCNRNEEKKFVKCETTKPHECNVHPNLKLDPTYPWAKLLHE